MSSLSSARLSHPSPSPLAHFPGLRIIALAGVVGTTIEKKEIDESNPTRCNIFRRAQFCSFVDVVDDKDDKAVDSTLGGTQLNADTEDAAATRVRRMSSK